MKHGLSGVVKDVQKAMKRHSPEILTGIGIAGMITTTVMAVKATPKALILIEEAKDDINRDLVDIALDEDQDCTNQIDRLKPLDLIRVTWKCYIPAVAIGGMSILCLIGASSVNVRRNAALATAYTLSESALREYQEKVVEHIGAKKEQAVRDDIAKDKLERDPVIYKEIIITERGNTLCYDSISGRYFKSDIEKLRKAQNELNRQMLDEMYISLNDFYYEIGLNNTSMGDNLGWHVDKGLIDLQFSSQLATDGTPCLVMDYRLAPEYEFRF